MSDLSPLLEVDDLHVSFATEDGTVKAVDGVSFSVASGEVVAIVGESGSGKSVTAMTLMGLTRGPNAQFEGAAHFDGQELIDATDAQLRKVRGAGIAMVFQDPMSSLWTPSTGSGRRSSSRSACTRSTSPRPRRSTGRSS